MITGAYQIPMNLDYMITSEDGTLIYSQDPNIGIATRSSVRFNIGGWMIVVVMVDLELGLDI
jgi:hypothetical protein